MVHYAWVKHILIPVRKTPPKSTEKEGVEKICASIGFNMKFSFFYTASLLSRTKTITHCDHLRIRNRFMKKPSATQQFTPAGRF